MACFERNSLLPLELLRAQAQTSSASVIAKLVTEGLSICQRY